MSEIGIGARIFEINRDTDILIDAPGSESAPYSFAWYVHIINQDDKYAIESSLSLLLTSTIRPSWIALNGAPPQ